MTLQPVTTEVLTKYKMDYDLVVKRSSTVMCTSLLSSTAVSELQGYRLTFKVRVMVIIHQWHGLGCC